MNRDEFLSALRDGLRGLPEEESNDIAADYSAHFSDGIASGRSEEEVARALGDPSRLAKELRAEAGLRRWREHRNAGNLFAAVFAFVGLATLDLVLLLPLLFAVAVGLFVFAVVLIAVFFLGIASVVSLLDWGSLSTVAGAIARFLKGVGLVAGAIGGGALLLIVLDALVRLLGTYARLHYRVLSPSNDAA
jgi:uncharacterized membrane protein